MGLVDSQSRDEDVPNTYQDTVLEPGVDNINRIAYNSGPISALIDEVCTRATRIVPVIDEGLLSEKIASRISNIPKGKENEDKNQQLAVVGARFASAKGRHALAKKG